jgi:hypothetical protein
VFDLWCTAWHVVHNVIRFSGRLLVTFSSM